MSKSFDVIYLSTPRHGYFKVNGDDVREVKISQSFSEFSFYDEDNDIFYLEEDCDVPLFAKRCELDGVELNITEADIDSEEEESLIRCHNNAEGGDYGYFGELQQNHTGIEHYFEEDNDDEEIEE